nr:cation transporter [Actinomycetota bacterium]
MTNRLDEGTRDGETNRHRHGGHEPRGKLATVVLHTGGLNWASEKAVVESVLRRRPGVGSVDANPVSQTATLTFDTTRTSVAELRRWVEECGLHCAGQSVPTHVCDAMSEPSEHGSHAMRTERAEREGVAEEGIPSPHEAMGHGGHAGMSMEGMVRDMRNRFLEAALLS